MPADFRQEFIRFAVEQKVLCFGEFKTKAGRISPYFFNAGLFHHGVALKKLAQFYAKAIRASDVRYDMLFGPAYKGIPLVAAVAIALADEGRDVAYAFNRKEAKDHGEGGSVIGAPLEGRVLIVDDVISAGTSVRESVELIDASGAALAGVVIALDRLEKGTGDLSAVQEVRQTHGIAVISIATLDDLVGYLASDPALARDLEAVQRYRDRYGVTADGLYKTAT
ncbi:MAG TPA: orotate phosphoribosyltransferase [Burkholderiales bacterium]|nr:orotate phosphoribosyltransferase [Burkholderiales bacterium]